MQNLFTKPSFIFDIICLLLLVILSLWAGRRGFVATLVELAGNLISLLAGRFVALWAAPLLFENFLAASFHRKIVELLDEAGGSLDLMAMSEEVAGFLPESLRLAIVETFTKKVGGALTDATVNLADSIVEKVIEPMITPVLAIVIFFVVFIICRLLVSFLVNVLGVVNHIPVLGTVNRWLGLAMGFVAGAVDLFLILCIVWAMIVITGGNLPWLTDKALADSFFYGLFSRLNPFVLSM